MAKYKIIPSSRTIAQLPISIGHKAEKGVEAIEFDLTAWVETYGSGTLTVIMRRWGDAIPYPIALEIDENNKATWTLSDIDTAKAGMAYAQLSYIVGETVVKKSDIYTFRVMDSLTGEGEPPEAYESWLEQLTHIAAEAMAEVLDIEGIVTDKTLTVDGGIADGKATGDALALKADRSTTYTKTEVDNLIESVDVETDTTLSVSGKAADAKTVGDAISEINESLGDQTADLNNKFPNGNNLLVLNGEYSTRWNGVDITIKNNVISINGTSTNPITVKLTNGYDVSTNAKAAWDDEDVSFFEIGKTYHYGIETVSGTFPDGVGCPARANGSSIVSVSIPVATISVQPNYIMLYIPKNTACNCSFIPYYINAYTGNNLYRYTLNDNVKIASKQLPASEFNHFTVTVKDATGNDKVTQCVVTLPSNYDVDGKPTPLIMFCHGREGIVTETMWANSTDKLTLIRSFTNAGYGVFDVDATSHPTGGAVDVGCPELMESYIKAFEYIKDTYNVDDRLILYGYSFGTFALMNMICWYPALIRTACISAMRASVKAVYDRGEPFQAEIANNFGFADGYSVEKMQGYDPYANIVTVGNVDMLMKQIPPLKVLTATGDTLELERSHTLITAWRASGNAIDWKEVEGSNHHNMCYLTDAGLRSEVVAWFNRYR